LAIKWFSQILSQKYENKNVDCLMKPDVKFGIFRETLKNTQFFWVLEGKLLERKRLQWVWVR
jgi:hypothetical protein